MLNTNPPKGTQDRYPEEFHIRKYIFDTRRKVCLRFGYQEYLGPLVESIDIWKAKSGEDVGGSELTRLTDREGNISDLALRPEMTPTVTRMVAKNYAQLAKPIRYFSIANFYRNERPQRGRNREFWQLNVDCFGTKNSNADIEILTLAIELMKAFEAPENSREVHINNRYIIDEVLEKIKINSENKQNIVRILDKRKKLKPETRKNALMERGVSGEQAEQITQYMKCTTLDELLTIFPNIKDSKEYQDTLYIIDQLKTLGYEKHIKYATTLIRGFDYYNGMVFEIFDTHPENNRALFGGGRYNGLSTIFIKEEIPAVGFAPGDETIKIFLESRGLLDTIKKKTQKEIYYLPILDNELTLPTQKLAQKLREEKKNIILGLETQHFGKAIKYANKNNVTAIIIFGTQEYNNQIYTIKNLKTGKEKTLILKL